MSTVVTEDEAGVRKGAPQRRAQASGVGEAVGQKTDQAVAGGGRSSLSSTGCASKARPS